MHKKFLELTMMESKREPNRETRFLNSIYNEASIDREILPAVTALRNAGVETTASSSGIGEVGSERGWGSYIQILIASGDHLQIIQKIDAFAKHLTSELREELKNPLISLEVVSAEQWFKDNKTTSMDVRIPVYRLQLVGYMSDQEVVYAWKAVGEKFDSSIIE